MADAPPKSENIDYWYSKAMYLEMQVKHYEIVIDSLKKRLNEQPTAKKRGRPIKKGYVLAPPSDYEEG